MDFLQTTNVPDGYKPITMVWSLPCKSIKEAFNEIASSDSEYGDLLIGTHIITSNGGSIRGNAEPTHFEVYGTLCKKTD